MKSIVTRYVLNHTITYPVIMYALSSTGIKVRFHDFPSFLEFFVQIQFLFFCEDFFFYLFHRATHDSKLLYKIHKYHHQYDKIFIMIRDDFLPIDYFSGVVIHLLYSSLSQWVYFSLEAASTASLITSGFSGKSILELKITQDTTSLGAQLEFCPSSAVPLSMTITTVLILVTSVSVLILGM